MEDIIDLIATDSSSSDISAKVKEVLFAKASERLDALRPSAAASMFDENNPEESEEE